ncbi:YHYH domain-containing protein [Jannaschia sp. LMIT008]|nr:YHYH domain-containing protein [Jannaschia sp. LMIT008]
MTHPLAPLALLLTLLTLAPALAHDGDTDERGCHHSEKEGYHCH